MNNKDLEAAFIETLQSSLRVLDNIGSLKEYKRKVVRLNYILGKVDFFSKHELLNVYTSEIGALKSAIENIKTRYNIIVDMTYIQELLAHKSSRNTFLLFQDFIKGITFFENEDKDNVMERTKWICCMNQPTLSKKEKANIIETCYIETLIYEILLHYNSIELSKEIVNEIDFVKSEYKIFFPDHEIIVDIELEELLPVAVNVSKYTNKMLTCIERYEKNIYETTYKNKYYNIIVICKKIDLHAEYRKYQSFYSKSDWGYVRKNDSHEVKPYIKL